MTPTINHLESLAHLCASLQAPYSRIHQAVESLGLKPAVTINGIGHFDAAQCERIATHLQGERARLDGKAPETLVHRPTEHT